MRRPTFALRLTRYAQITPGVREFSFQRADGEPLAYEAGQFFNIHFEHDGRPMHRSYSVANPPAADGVVDFAVAPVDNGRATRLLFALEAGDLINASGPYGRFVLRDDPPCRYVLVGTGTGIAPYRAMLPTIERHLRDGRYRFALLVGVRSEQELLYGDEFREFAKQHPGFDFHGCLSREDPPPGRADLHRGYVQQQFEPLQLHSERDIIYLCGNPEMVDASMALLKSVGFSSKHLRREKYVSPRN
jgi:ferredoxin-NADP reductase